MLLLQRLSQCAEIRVGRVRLNRGFRRGNVDDNHPCEPVSRAKIAQVFLHALLVGDVENEFVIVNPYPPVWLMTLVPCTG